MTEPSLATIFLALSILFGGLLTALPRRRVRRRSRQRLPVPPPTWSLESVLSLLQLRHFHDLGPEAQASVVERLRAADRGPLSMREHGRVNLILGEIALSRNDRDEARLRYRAALRWDPTLPIRRTVERLEAPALALLAPRRAA